MKGSDPLAWVQAVGAQIMYISEKSSINVPFSFVCTRGVAEENALLDSGATENFMDQRMVERLGISLRLMKEPRRVFNVDGTENKHGTLTHCTLLRVKKGDKDLLQWFYVTSLGADRVMISHLQYAYHTIADSQWTVGPLTHLCLPLLRDFLVTVAFLV